MQAKKVQNLGFTLIFEDMACCIPWGEKLVSCSTSELKVVALQKIYCKGQKAFTDPEIMFADNMFRKDQNK